jgi:hypothetical protein
MWWVKAGTIPEVEEAKARLKYLQAKGESELAFGFRQSFAPSAQHLDLPTE